MCFAAFLVYWFDRLEKQQKGDKISVFFEMTGAGLSNMDMEFVQYLIMLFRDYYPYFLNYIIIFEMSWILNGTIFIYLYDSFLNKNQIVYFQLLGKLSRVGCLQSLLTW